MGTRGYYAYRYQGRYFQRYVNNDSYPNGLGEMLVSCVPEDPEEFKLWLERTRAILASFDRLDEDSDDEADDQTEDFSVILRKDFKFSRTPPDLENMIEWIYTFDLDMLTFSVQGSVHYPLDNIPRGRDEDGMLWIEKYICSDVYPSKFCRAPSTPAEYCARTAPVRTLIPQEKEDLTLFEEAAVQTIDPSTWMEDDALVLQQKLAALAAGGLIEGYFSRYSEAYALFYDPTTELFAKELLTSASPAGAEFSDDREVVDRWFWELSGMRGRRRRNVFWFRGCLVVLTFGLEEPDRFKAAVGMVIRRVRESNLKNCTAILWSMDHVAVVVFSEDSVSCSEPIGFVSAYGRDEAEYKQGLRLIARYLPPPCLQGNTSFESRLPMDTLLRVMGFLDSESASIVGRTCKALRLEWLKRPTIGPYTLISAQEDDMFIAARIHEDEDIVFPVRLSIRFPKCMRYDEFRRYVCYARWDAIPFGNNTETRARHDRVVYGPGKVLSGGETERVTDEVRLRIRFLDPDDYVETYHWRLVVIESKSEE